jgi:hypothetical protein
LEYNNNKALKRLRVEGWGTYPSRIVRRRPRGDRARASGSGGGIDRILRGCGGPLGFILVRTVRCARAPRRPVAPAQSHRRSAPPAATGIAGRRRRNWGSRRWESRWRRRQGRFSNFIANALAMKFRNRPCRRRRPRSHRREPQFRRRRPAIPIAAGDALRR